MNQPEFLPKILLILHRDSGPRPYFATCELSGDTRELHVSRRQFGTLQELAEAFNAAGMEQERYRDTLKRMEDGWDAALEIDLNEAQKLSVVHTETTE